MEPRGETVAPNSNASFECAASGRYPYLQWEVNGDMYSKGSSMPEGYNVTWHTAANSSSTRLEISALVARNETIVLCRAGTAEQFMYSRVAYLNIAG